MSEAERGCGYRKIGGLYLTGDPGITLVCDGLPLELKECACCGFEPPFSRNLQRIQPKYVLLQEMGKHRAFDAEQLKENCKCPSVCPICYPKDEPMGLMYVGKKFYTPRSFIREAETMGVCKRIPDVPKWLRLGETWVLLAHAEVPKVSLEKIKSNEMLMKEPEKMKAIFYVFKPQRIEMPVFKDYLSNEEILILEKKGITPVILDPTPENKKRHGRARNLRTLMRLLKPDEEEQGE